jgi:hypothetical protein
MRFQLDSAGWIPEEVKEAIRRAVGAHVLEQGDHAVMVRLVG